MLDVQPKFWADRHKQVLSESHRCDLCPVSVTCCCARANLIEAGVLPWHYQTRDRLLLGCTPAHFSFSWPSMGSFKTQKEQDEAFYRSVCAYNLS